MRFGYTAGCVGDNGSVLCENYARVLASCYWRGETADSAGSEILLGTFVTPLPPPMFQPDPICYR